MCFFSAANWPNGEMAGGETAVGKRMHKPVSTRLKKYCGSKLGL
jgi:hypothetical protein